MTGTKKKSNFGKNGIVLPYSCYISQVASRQVHRANVPADSPEMYIAETACCNFEPP